MSGSLDVLQSLRARNGMAGEVPLPTPAFNLMVGWAADYPSLFMSRFASVEKPHSLTNRVLDRRRVLLSGRGGSGKTVLLRREFMTLSERRDKLPVFISLKRWTDDDYEEWKQMGSEGVTRIPFLLTKFMEYPKADPLELYNLPAIVDRVLFVDGLNEVRSATGQEILEELDQLVSCTSYWFVIVSDRLTRRSLPAASCWSLATVRPLSVDERIRLLKRESRGKVDLPLLESPYFMNIYLLQVDDSAHSPAQMLETWFLTHSGVSGTDELAALSCAAFEMYRRHKSRTFPIADLQAIVGVELVQKLRDSRALELSGERARFDHHLKHDFLAARHLPNIVAGVEPVSQEEIRAALNALTFRASSFDAFALALELAGSAGAAECLVRAFYDYSWYGTTYALAESRVPKAAAVSLELGTALLALTAEKKWDFLLKTAERASDALMLFGDQEAGMVTLLVGATSLDDVFQAVLSLQSDEEWFKAWRELFCSRGTNVNVDRVIEQMAEADSVFGWTAANVLRRVALGTAHVEQVLGLMTDAQSASIRWRAAHAAGAIPTAECAAALLSRLNVDEDEWVRYGCVRSLVEIAARRRAVRKSVFDGLVSGAQEIAKHLRTVGEMRSALFVDGARLSGDEWQAEEWKAAVTPVVETYHDAAADSSERTRWQRAAIQLRSRYHEG